MYRLLVLIFLVSLFDCYRQFNHGYRYTHRRRFWHYHKHDRRFERLASHVIAADRYLQGFCQQNTNCNAYDIYETQGYKLVYNLPQCSVNYISVKIKHRVLYMSARQITHYNPAVFVDMRVLPDLLKLDEAVWTYNAGKLEITIPYKKDFKTEWEKTCGDISTHVINVPRWGFQFGYRFGENEEDSTGATNETESTSDDDTSPDTGTDAYDTPGLLNDTSEAPTPDVTTSQDRLIFSN